MEDCLAEASKGFLIALTISILQHVLALFFVWVHCEPAREIDSAENMGRLEMQCWRVSVLEGEDDSFHPEITSQAVILWSHSGICGDKKVMMGMHSWGSCISWINEKLSKLLGEKGNEKKLQQGEW